MGGGLAIYKFRGEGLSGKVDDIITYPIVTRDDKTSVAASELMTHRKFMKATVPNPLKITGVNVITCPLGISKFRYYECCTSYLSTPGAHLVKCVLSTEKKLLLKGALLTDDSPKFCVICVILIFLPIDLHINMAWFL